MKCLVLNLDYTPLCIVSYKRAIVLLMKNNNMIALSYYDNKKIHSEKQQYDVPSILLYQKYVQVKYCREPSKKRILTRDLYVCQYCNINIPSGQATVDHIIPLSRFKQRKDSNKWSNLVACCRKCNTFKGNRTPEEAGMKLIRKPKEAVTMAFDKNIPIEWREFLWQL